MGKRYLVTEGQLSELKNLLEVGDLTRAEQDIELIISRQFIGDSNTPVVQDAENLKVLIEVLRENSEKEE